MNCHIVGIRGEDAYLIRLELEDKLCRFRVSIVNIPHEQVLDKMHSAILSTIHFNQNTEEWLEEIESGKKLMRMQQGELSHGADSIPSAMVSPPLLTFTLFSSYLNRRYCHTCGVELPESWLYEYCDECMTDAGIIT